MLAAGVSDRGQWEHSESGPARPEGDEGTGLQLIANAVDGEQQ
jgi:hypothetical protein